MKNLPILLGLLLQVCVAKAQIYTHYEVRDIDDTDRLLNNYPMQFRFTSGAFGTPSSFTGLDPRFPGWITFSSGESSACGNIETVHPSATIIGSVWSCLSNPGPNNFIKVRNTNTTSFKINGNFASTSSGSPSVFCDATSLTWSNFSWYAPKISSATLRIYDYTGGTDVLISSNSYGSGGAPASINLLQSGYIGTMPGKYRIELSNTFASGTITYNAYIHVKYAVVSISGSYKTRPSNASSAPFITNYFGPYTSIPSNDDPSRGILTVGRSSTTFDISAATDPGSGAGVCSIIVHMDKGSMSSPWSWTNDIIPALTYSGTCAAMATKTVYMSNFLDASGFTFFNFTNAPVYSIWRVRLELVTPCGTIWRALPFRIGDRPTATASGYIKEAGPGTGESNIRFAPVPFATKLSAVLQLAENSQVSLNIYSIDGRVVASPYSNNTLKAGATALDLETGSWPSGIYLYECTVNGEKMTGKIIK